MIVAGQHALLIAILLWLSGFVVGGGIATLLTMLYVYRWGQRFIARREEEGENDG